MKAAFTTCSRCGLTYMVGGTGSGKFGPHICMTAGLPPRPPDPTIKAAVRAAGRRAVRKYGKALKRLADS